MVRSSGPVQSGCRQARALVDPFRQCSHLGHAGADLLPQEHAPAPWLGSLPDDHFDGVGFAQIVGIEAVAGRKALIDERLGRLPFFGSHAPVARCRRRARRGRQPSEALL